MAKVMPEIRAVNKRTSTVCKIVNSSAAVVGGGVCSTGEVAGAMLKRDIGGISSMRDGAGIGKSTWGTPGTIGDITEGVSGKGNRAWLGGGITIGSSMMGPNTTAGELLYGVPAGVPVMGTNGGSTWATELG